MRPSFGEDSVVGVICAHDEEKNIGRAVRTLRALGKVDEVVVVDGHSSDRTGSRAERAGARVVLQREERYPGKGVAVQTALEETDQDVLLFFDADIHNMEPWQPEALLDGVLERGADHAMARFTRKGGRVTELTAKPLFRIFFPEVQYQQPLTGEFASRREVLRAIDIVPDWGIESGLVIDLTMNEAVVLEVDTGHKQHPMKPLEELKVMADQVTRTILGKAIHYGRMRHVADLREVSRLREQEVMQDEPPSLLV